MAEYLEVKAANALSTDEDCIADPAGGVTPWRRCAFVRDFSYSDAHNFPLPQI